MENEHEMLGGDDDVDEALMPTKQEERDILDEPELNGGGVGDVDHDDDLLGLDHGGEDNPRRVNRSHDHEPPGAGVNKTDNDLFDAVLTERSNAKQTSSTSASASPSPSHGSQSHKDSQNVSSAASLSFGATTVAGRKYCVYAGNMTWWTTDLELAAEVREIGVEDIIDIKFYYNHSNGQSKGFALVVMGSEGSQRRCLDKLSGRQLHGQSIAVLPYSKASLAQFEAATVSSRPTDRRLTDQRPAGGQPVAAPTPAAVVPTRSQPLPAQPTSAKAIAASQAAAAAMSAAGTPMHVGTVRIGSNAPAAPPQQNPPQQQGPPMIRLPMAPMGQRAPPAHVIGQPFVVGMSMSGPVRVLGPPPPGVMSQGMRPMGMGPPPGTNLGPPMRMGPPGAPPPNTAHAPPGMPPPGAHVNPNVYPNVAAAQGAPQYNQAPPSMPPPQGAMPAMGHMQPQQQQQQQQQQHYGHPPAGYHQQQQQQQQPQHAGFGRPAYGRPAEQPLSDAEFEEVMNRNRTVSSSAISRAVSDAAARDYSSAVETLVTAISLIKQSRVAHDDRCKVLITSLEDTLSGIEAKASYRTSSTKSSRSHGREHSRSPDAGQSSRRKRHRRASRSRSRSPHRDRSDASYSERRSHVERCTESDNALKAVGVFMPSPVPFTSTFRG